MFGVYASGSSSLLDYTDDASAPWSSTFTLDSPGTYRLEAVARDAWYESAPAVVTITVTAVEP